MRQPAVENAQITLESHLAELAALRNAARAARDYGAAIRAEIARGKAAGLYVERLEVEHRGPTLVEILVAVSREERADLPRMLASSDPAERQRGLKLQEEEQRRLARGRQAERPSAAAPCPATDGVVRGVTTTTATPNTHEA
ncbi:MULTISPECIES: hypothetical protein [Paraburkholderia]|uniref:hypothetical protein n=1 Tax=Paraburkholderia TaxID=1822464 RepID=UPI001583FCF5|nr:MULTISPECIES: hypothetical protein [Paraburkholderia]